ncbi:deoxyribonuclease TATDN3 [Biomphalaria pfeifferi]|uniref:Deoxyribonuclease TATDN3 n=1 Tax=Biomphalaria pfeifferi TaxID=112525 RepID=A0AAD8AWV8_BIOPF|nr:deoxyribonuclease TATDN3 [Biomphalaria pfeifferi]
MEQKREFTHIVDVHTHLSDDLLIKDVGEIIQRAVQQNVYSALVVAESKLDFQPILDLHHRYPEFVLPCLGIHPIQNSGKKDEKGIEIKRSVCPSDYDGVEEWIEKHVDLVGAVGEIGLDFTPRFCPLKEDKENQILIFSKQVQLAERLHLPINVHSRSASKQTIQLLKEIGAHNVLLHAFDGRASTALQGVAYGFYFSIPASVCRDEQLQKLLKVVPLDHLMIETDSPAISPVKGTVNEPANAVISCEYIAQLKNVDIQTVKHMTTTNAMKLFPKLATLPCQMM